MNRTTIKCVVLIIGVLFLLSCKKKHATNERPDPKDGYFSIVQFTLDQWNTFNGQPFTLIKIVTENGKADSSFVGADTLDWGNDIFKLFFATDISNKKYLGRYRFSSFDDNITSTHTFYYEAIDKDLFTRKLQITIDPVNNRILSIFIETQKNSGVKGIMQKLYYKPLKRIQIQEFGNTSVGAKMQRETEYIFML